MLRISKILSKVWRKKEGGFVLMELIVAILIAGIIITGISTVVLQVISVKALSANILTATKQVENTFHHLLRDAQMSLNIPVCQNGTEPEPGEPEEWIVFTWNWGVDHRVAYEIEEDTGEIYRNHTIDIDGDGSPDEEERMQVAKFIDTNLLYAEVSEDVNGYKTMEITVVATVGGYKTDSETRILNVNPRLSPT